MVQRVQPGKKLTGDELDAGMDSYFGKGRLLTPPPYHLSCIFPLLCFVVNITRAFT